jgi:hypothetical protein
MLALVIDRCTSAEVSKINYEIGHSVYWWNQGRRFHSSFNERERLEKDLETAVFEEKRKKRHGESAEYESLLREYVQLKLYLHNLRKTLYYPYDTYTPPDDYKKLLARCEEIRQQIAEKRRIVVYSAWGGLEPARKPTDYDKPILSSLEERTCQFVLYSDADDEEGHTCPFNGEHWYRGEPYCRKHFRETRYAARKKRQIEARAYRVRLFKAAQDADARRVEAQRQAENDEHRRFNTFENCTDPLCEHAPAGRHAHVGAALSMLEFRATPERPMLPHGKANGRKGAYFA